MLLMITCLDQCRRFLVLSRGADGRRRQGGRGSGGEGYEQGGRGSGGEGYDQDGGGCRLGRSARGLDGHADLVSGTHSGG